MKKLLSVLVFVLVVLVGTLIYLVHSYDLSGSGGFDGGDSLRVGEQRSIFEEGSLGTGSSGGDGG